MMMDMEELANVLLAYQEGDLPREILEDALMEGGFLQERSKYPRLPINHRHAMVVAVHDARVAAGLKLDSSTGRWCRSVA